MIIIKRAKIRNNGISQLLEAVDGEIKHYPLVLIRLFIIYKEDHQNGSFLMGVKRLTHAVLDSYVRYILKLFSGLVGWAFRASFNAAFR